MYLRLTLLISALIFSATDALAISASTDGSSHTSLVKTNRTTNVELTTFQSNSTTLTPWNFVGVECYTLPPATVDPLACQHVFAKLIGWGRVYEERKLYNRCLFRAGAEPCSITLLSPSPRDHRGRISISFADIIGYATTVLETCRETSTGGAKTLPNSWQVVVTRDPLARSLSNTNLSEE